MLLLHPRGVTFAGSAWEGVERVAVERTAETTIAARSDGGPHVVLADVPAQRVTVKVMQVLPGDAFDGPVPGDMGALRFDVGPNGSSASVTSVSMTAVVLAVTYGAGAWAGSGSRSAGGRGSGSSRTVTMLAVSSDGAADPVTVSSGS